MLALALLTAPILSCERCKAVLTALYLLSNFPLLICPEPTAIVCFVYSSLSNHYGRKAVCFNTGP